MYYYYAPIFIEITKPVYLELHWIYKQWYIYTLTLDLCLLEIEIEGGYLPSYHFFSHQIGRAHV